MFEQLIETSKARKELEAEIKLKKDEFEKSILSDLELLNSIQDKEEQLKKEVIEIFKKNNETNVQVDNSFISLNTKITPKIFDATSVYNYLSSCKLDIEKEFGIDFDELPLQLKFDTSFINKKEAIEFIEKFKKLFDIQDVPGFEESKTEYLMITKK